MRNHIRGTLIRSAALVGLAGAVVFTGCQTTAPRNTAEPARQAPPAATTDAPDDTAGNDAAQLAASSTSDGRRTSETASPVPGARASEEVRLARKKKWSTSTGGKQKLENPGQRGQERYNDRAGEDGIFTFDEVLAAKAHIEGMAELAVPAGDGLRDAGIWNWQWIGPGNIGGRIRSIVIHPTQQSRMWIGGVSGGIWYSSNGGASWSPVNDFLPSLAVCCMAIAPSNPNIMFAGSGEGFGNHDGLPGGGLFRSTNGGVSWSLVNDTDDWSYVNRVAIDPTDADHFVAATDHGLCTTHDGGATWDCDYAGTTMRDVKVAPYDGDLYIGTDGSGRVWRSTDGGDFWDQVPTYGNIGFTQLSAAVTPDANSADDTISVYGSVAFSKGDRISIGWGAANETSVVRDIPDNLTLVVDDLSNAHPLNDAVVSLPNSRTEVAFAPSAPGTIYLLMNVGRGAIFKSVNYGETFTFISNTTDDFLGGQGWYNNTIWVSPYDANFVVVGGIELWRSTNGAQSFTRISHGGYYDEGLSGHVDYHAIVNHPGFNNSSNRTVFVGNDGGIQKIDDIATVGQTSGWTNLANNLGITQFFGGAATPDGAYIIGGTQDNDTLHLHNVSGPQNWYYGEFSTDGGYCAIDYRNPSAPYFFKETQNLGIKRSSNFGYAYDLKINGLADAGNGSLVRFIAPFVMSPQNPSVLVAGGTSIWATFDSANNWTAINGPVTGSPKCSALGYSASNSTLIWAGYEGGQLWRTNGNVTSWVRVDDNEPTLPSRTVSDIAVNPYNPQEVMVTFAGYYSNSVWRTTDGGATWNERTGSGDHTLPALQVNSIVFHPLNTSWLYIGTDLGVFASEDKGQTWSKTPRFGNVGHEGPVNTEVSELFWQGNDYLIAATHGRGMYRTRPFSTVYVDVANTGFEDGSFANPFDTVVEGYNAAGAGTTISIKAGTYNETNGIVFSKRVDMIGRDGVVVIR